MSILSDLGNAITGGQLDTLQAEAQQASQQLQVAIAAMIGLQAISALLLFLLVVMTWKERH